jgi:uncharacterized protein YbaA (DUF1428 family)
MTYTDGFVAAVPQANKQAYLDHAREALSGDPKFGLSAQAGKI